MNTRSTNIEIDTREIKEFRGNEKIEEVEFKDENTLNVDGVFIAVGTATASDLAKKLGVLLKNDEIIVDEDMKTNINGLYAAGDCTGGLYQINKAVYEGAKAGLSAIKYLKNE